MEEVVKNTETNENTGNAKIIKIFLILLSLVVVIMSMFGNILTSDSAGAVGISSFESFYFYIIAIIAAIYMAGNNKNANIPIVIALLTYGWTYLLVQQMVDYFAGITKIYYEPLLFVYFGSAIFLLIALFINDKKEVVEEVKDENQIPEEVASLVGTNEGGLNKDNFIFANFVLGLRGIPLGTDVLMVNNIGEKTLDFIYMFNGVNQTTKISFSDIKNITFKTSMKMQNTQKKAEEHETKSMLLSLALYGGNPIMQTMGNSALNKLFDEVSNNYDKVSFNAYYEMVIEMVLNGEDAKFILETQANPEIFVNQLNNNKGM